MSVKVRPYRRSGWEVDIRVTLPDQSEHRLRRKAPVASKSAAQGWGEDRERLWYQVLTRPRSPEKQKEEVPTLREFWPRFLEGHARANRQKPSGIASKEMIARVYLLPLLGDRPLDGISTERVQQLKATLTTRAPKTVNNVLTVLNTMLKRAVEWGLIERMPCAVRLLPVPPPSAPFHDFEVFERLVDAARNWAGCVPRRASWRGGRTTSRRNHCPRMGRYRFEEASTLCAAVCLEGPHGHTERRTTSICPVDGATRVCAAISASPSRSIGVLQTGTAIH